MLIGHHYTSIDTFISILESTNIWAANLRNMNDPNEGAFGLDRLRNLIQKQYDTCLSNSTPDLDCFSVSFSLEDDVLSQWQAYANDGTGVSIGFDLDMLDQFITPTIDTVPFTSQIVNVKYGDEDFLGNANRFLSDKNFHDNPDEINLFVRFEQYAYKDLFYKEESEVRLVAELPNPLKFERGCLYQDQYKKTVHERVSPYGLTKYLHFQHSCRATTQTSIKSIRLGPKCPLGIEDVKYLLFKHGVGDYNTIKIAHSNGNYR